MYIIIYLLYKIHLYCIHFQYTSKYQKNSRRPLLIHKVHMHVFCPGAHQARFGGTRHHHLRNASPQSKQMQR